MASRYGEQLKAGFSGLRRRRTEADESGEVSDSLLSAIWLKVYQIAMRGCLGGLFLQIVSAKSSVKLLYDIISRFDDFKRDLVKSIGFGGILCFPPLRQLNRRFAVWLMSKVDPRSQTLVIDDSRRIRFTKEDVFRVFGIPCSGRSVFCNGIPSKEVISKVMSCYLGTDVREHQSIKAAQEVIERDYGQTMSVEEQNSFKAAFVIYVMSTLLSPGAKYDYASIDYWNALVEPSDIGKYDWGDYVIRRLFDAVVKVLYLDSIDTGFLNMDHTVLPRVMFFGPENMRSMILADTVDECNGGCLSVSMGKARCFELRDVYCGWKAAVPSPRPVDALRAVDFIARFDSFVDIAR
nr:unnamed protein product [Digitaria exilis]